LYVNSEQKIITLCADYVKKVWGTDGESNPINGPTTKYDGCGMFNPGEAKSDTEKILLPSKVNLLYKSLIIFKQWANA
jgi:hypothetical protein